MTKAVLLDLGNVIVGLDTDRVYRAVAALSPLTLAEVPGRIRAAGLYEPYERGEMSSEQFHSRFCKALQIDGLDFAGFSRLWGDMFQPAPLLSGEMLEGLRARYRLILVSNTNELHFRWIREHYPLLRHFHDYVLSYQVGTMKPSAGIYREAIRRAGCLPAECFFADDVAENVAGARRQGIDALLFSGEEPLKSELAQRGIIWNELR
jgi:putative hydrolase of the HAD superfamily